MTKILTDRQLQIKTLKAINVSVKNEKNKMVSLANDLIKSPSTPIKWRKKQSKGLLNFILENRNLSKEEIIEKLKEIEP